MQSLLFKKTEPNASSVMTNSEFFVPQSESLDELVSLPYQDQEAPHPTRPVLQLGPFRYSPGQFFQFEEPNYATTCE